MDVVPELPKVKHDFASIVESISLHAWTMSQFVIWLDLKLSEYKVTGYMVLDQSCGSLPDWLANIDADNFGDITADQNPDIQYAAPERHPLDEPQLAGRSSQQHSIQIPDDDDDDRVLERMTYLESKETRELKRTSKPPMDRDTSISNKKKKIVHDYFRYHDNRVPSSHLDSNQDARQSSESRRSSASQPLSPSHTITQRTSAMHQKPRDGLGISRDPFSNTDVTNNVILPSESWAHGKGGNETPVESRFSRERLLGADVSLSNVSSNVHHTKLRSVMTDQSFMNSVDIKNSENVTNSPNMSSAVNLNRLQAGSEVSYESSANDGSSRLIAAPSSHLDLEESIVIKEEDPDSQEAGCAVVDTSLPSPSSQLVTQIQSLRDPFELPKQCPKCSKTFFNKKYHLAFCTASGTVPAVQTWPCEVCGSTFSSKSTMVRHKKSIHENRTFACPCGQMFRWKTSPKNHLRKCPAGQESNQDVTVT